MKSTSSRLAAISLTALGLAACGTGQVKSTQPFDLSNPGAIEIIIDATNKNLNRDDLKQQVAKNLSDWNYPVASAQSQDVSHNMTVLIGTTERGSTPSGFSFNMGNSDPRALDFQKADVLPITCRFSSISQPDHSAELNMGFSDSAVTRANPDLKEISDHVSTVCFNLLREINWPVKKTESGNKSGGLGWIPEIQIETEAETAQPAIPQQSSGNRPQPAQLLESGEEAPKPVTKEITKEGRKVYIIHNQGNPITFKFGHERK